MRFRNLVWLNTLLPGLLSFACSIEKKEVHQPVIPVVQVTSIQSLQPSVLVVLPGELKPWNKTNVHAKVKGYVARVLVDRGNHVKKGQTLTVLDAPEIIAELNHAKARVSSAHATLIQQQAKQRVSKLTYTRMLETSRTLGAVSANELDLSLAQMLTDSALYQGAEENLRAAEALLASQTQLADYLIVRAAFDGNITERNISPGDLVGPEGNSKPLFVLEDCSTLRLVLAVPESFSKSIQAQSSVSFSVLADPLKAYRAKFGRSSNSLQETNRNMIIEFDFDNKQGKLKAGMYAEVKIPVMRDEATTFVPKDALIHSTEGVFVVRARDSMAEWVNVTKGNSIDTLVEVFGGLHANDQIIRHANEELRNGQSIKIQ